MTTTFNPNIPSPSSTPVMVPIVNKMALPSFFSGPSYYIPSLSQRHIVIAGASAFFFLFLRCWQPESSGNGTTNRKEIPAREMSIGLNESYDSEETFLLYNEEVAVIEMPANWARGYNY